MSSTDEKNKPESDEKPHKCPYDDCNAAFYRPYRLKDHIAKHEGEKPYKCTISGCDKSYTNGWHLRRHKMICHEEMKSKRDDFLCPETGCGMILANKYSLQKHMKLHDESNCPFKCAVCSEKFKKKRHLNEHSFVHTGNIPFRCSTCNDGFLSSKAFKKHMKNHKTYTCDCEEVYDKWSKYSLHRKTCKTKTVHKCVICDKTFAQLSSLKQHSLTHIEESQLELYHCHYLNCNRSYKYKKNLTYHISYFHEKSNDSVGIPCTEPNCNKEFKTKVCLKKHILNMHSGKPKVKKPRKARKDKGKRKKCAAAILSGIDLTPEEHLKIINNKQPLEINRSLLDVEVQSVLGNLNQNSQLIESQA